MLIQEEGSQPVSESVQSDRLLLNTCSPRITFLSSAIPSKPRQAENTHLKKKSKILRYFLNIVGTRCYSREGSLPFDEKKAEPSDKNCVRT